MVLKNTSPESTNNLPRHLKNQGERPVFFVDRNSDYRRKWGKNVSFYPLSGDGFRARFRVIPHPPGIYFTFLATQIPEIASEHNIKKILFCGISKKCYSRMKAMSSFINSPAGVLTLFIPLMRVSVSFIFEIIARVFLGVKFRIPVTKSFANHAFGRLSCAIMADSFTGRGA